MKNEKDILKWFNNELSEQEINDLKQSEDISTLDKIAHYSQQLQAPRIDVERALNEFKAKHATEKKETKVIPLNFKSFLRVAAILIVALGASYFAFFNNEKSFSTDYAETQTLNLPDNSEVILNAASELAFNKRTWEDNRDVILDGEAYFKVSKGQTFSVNTDAGIVKVLGTQFNVKERDGYFEVQCFEGLVSVTHNNETVKLPIGNRFRVIDGIVSVSSDLADAEPSWLLKESSFDAVPLKQVIDELERQYGLKIKPEGIDTSQLFTGSFTHDNKNTALQSVTVPLQLSYKIDGNSVTLYTYNGE
ncbi:FecR family protein [Winogradskyella sp. A3E31]|uniref:FecR family protein n=1 Tax=Winogradskyella sp. A3E31 TaxID=3349637 RepID=UPI00398B1E2A